MSDFFCSEYHYDINNNTWYDSMNCMFRLLVFQKSILGSDLVF